CDRFFHCKNGNDERGCTNSCKNKILCASGLGCFKVEERCNGLPDCTDYSDEQNCTLELCRAEHGSFLCANGRCIRKAWTCDKSDDCGDSSDELGEANCLKNSVITAALMGSLICGLLLVIAISCTCKLISLRQAEQRQEFTETQSQNSNNIYVSHQYPRLYPFHETQLFRVEHDMFFREPPPKNVSVATPTFTVDDIIPSDEQQTASAVLADNKIAQQSNDKCSNISTEDSTAEENSPTNAINIELDNIPSLPLSDCDQQPLLS
ncbi:low-density lipoprotein receptor-like protein 8, partial [Leptotrombidium deliense]